MSYKTLLWLASLTIAIVVAACGGSDDSPDTAPSLTVLSSRADVVSDGSALVQISASAADLKLAKLTIRQRDITSQLTSTGDTTMVALVTDLSEGPNEVVATIGDASTKLTLTNSSKNGAIFSGPQQMPWICQTSSLLLTDGSSLGAALDTNCNAPTKVLYLYMPTAGTAFKVLPSTSQLPADMSQTTTYDGRQVNYIVRLEVGTVNRGIYQIAVLFDPGKDQVPNPAGTFSAWNRKLIYTYGGGAGPGYIQGTSTGGVLVGYMLAKGFAVASSTLNVGGNYLNDVTSAETTSMVKEIFIKKFGPPIYTMGWGGSGGSIQQHLIANNYPGLLDGITPQLSFPDILTLITPVQDCAVLRRAFAQSTQTWTDAQKTAVAGYSAWRNCDNGSGSSFASDFLNSYNFLAAKRVAPNPALPNCNAAIAASLVYDPATNPTGARCSLYDGQKVLLGVDSAGYAKRPWDNTGVQYGLNALASGAITVEQFVQLNELVGGFDGDGNLQPSRSIANPDALQAAYAYGRINEFQNLSSVPILDFRAYSETDPNVHDLVRSFMSRARLLKATGSTVNHVIWRAPEAAPSPGPVPPQPIVDQAIAVMDQWLTSIKKDSGPGNPAERVARNKPSSLTDGCFAASGQFIAEVANIDNRGQCASLYPAHADPRLAAGAPLTGDIQKCQLKPLQRSDYSGITDAQFARLGAVFVGGVCDYNKPSAGSTPLQSSWLRYTAPGVAVAM